MARKFLREKGIDFIEYNVAENEQAKKEMEEKSHQIGVPVIDIDGHIFVGFDRRAIEIELERSGISQS
jgi:glutaredoxin